MYLIAIQTSRFPGFSRSFWIPRWRVLLGLCWCVWYWKMEREDQCLRPFLLELDYIEIDRKYMRTGKHEMSKGYEEITENFFQEKHSWKGSNLKLPGHLRNVLSESCDRIKRYPPRMTWACPVIDFMFTRRIPIPNFGKYNMSISSLLCVKRVDLPSR